MSTPPSNDQQWWYPVPLRWRGQTLFLLWQSDEWALDRVLANDGQVVSFSDEESARDYADKAGLPLAPNEQPHMHDLDRAVRWLEADEEPDFNLFLNVWNLAGDVARSVGEPFEDQGELLNGIYDKLFHVTRPPSMTHPSQRHGPEWSEEELAVLHTMIQASVDLIGSRLAASDC